MKEERITGIILCGGKASRMGIEKGLALLNQRPLIEYTVSVLKPITGQILISSNTHSYSYLGFPVIADQYPGSGPMGGIFSCLGRSETIGNLVLSCDTPFVNTELLNNLISVGGSYDVVVPFHTTGFYEPLCALYKKSVLDVMQSFIKKGNFKIPDLFKVLNTYKYELPAGTDVSRLFFNINAPADLATATQLLKNT